MNIRYYLTIGLMAGIISCRSESKVKVIGSVDSIDSNIVSQVETKEARKEEDAKGVLILRTDSADIAKSSFAILNRNKSVYAEVESTNDSEPSSDRLKNKILAYYPEYYIIHFSAEILSDSLYSVQVGADTKLIRKGAYMEYLSWPDYILRFFVTTTRTNPLRIAPKSSAAPIPNLDYSALSFRCVEISGDWVKVTCNKACEGCVDGKEVTGWIRWKENGKVILKQYYTC